MSGILGKIFDFNNNGKLDAGEMAAELLFLDKITNGAEDTDNYDPFTAYDGDDNDPYDD
jgi:hypothetical protein